jgi:hypothetical protein
MAIVFFVSSALTVPATLIGQYGKYICNGYCLVLFTPLACNRQALNNEHITHLPHPAPKCLPRPLHIWPNYFASYERIKVAFIPQEIVHILANIHLSHCQLHLDVAHRLRLACGISLYANEISEVLAAEQAQQVMSTLVLLLYMYISRYVHHLRKKSLILKVTL